MTDATAPVITPIADGTKQLGEPITPVRVTTDDPTATVTVDGLPDGLTFDPATGLIEGTPTKLGEYTVTVTATDEAGNTSTLEFKVTVVDPDAPVITPIDPVTAPADTPITPIAVEVDDPAATVEVTGLPDGLSYNPATGQIEGTPTTPGNYQVTITATDDQGNSSQITVEITITEPVDTTGPVITPIAPVAVPAGTGIAPITVIVDDPDATVTVDGLPDGLVYNPITGRIEGTPTTPGSYLVTITATDAAGNSSAIQVEITVTDDTAPVIDAGNAAVPAGTEITPIAVTTDDPTATVTVDGLPDGLTFDPATGQITGQTDAIGVHEVTITATDLAGNTTTKVITITVNDPDGPQITPIEPVTVEQGQQIEPIQIIVDDPAATIEVTDLPDGLVFDPETGQISGAPSTPGDYYVTIVATNAEGKSTTAVVRVSVTDHTAPAINPVANVDVTTGSEMAPIVITTDDPSATISVLGLPPELFFDPVTGQITGIPTKDGVFTVTVIATDAAGNTSELTLTITVTTPVIDEPDPPVVDPEPTDEPKPTPDPTPTQEWGDGGKPTALPKTPAPHY